MSANFNRTASYYDNSDPNYYEYISWSMGLTYVVSFPGEIPAKYKSWDTNTSTELGMIAFPTVGFTVKFGDR